MIPHFPIFTKVSLESRPFVESFTHTHKPYSDFNFASLWSWDSQDEREVSILNDNLVVRFTDYSTNEYSYSFLGTNKTTETAAVLVQFAKDNGVSPILTLMPEEAVGDIDCNLFEVKEDESNFDYIFSISDLAHLQGSKYKSKRHLSKNFENNNQGNGIDFRVISSTDSLFLQEVETVLKHWEENKKIADKDYDLENEGYAIRKLLSADNYNEVILSLLYVNNSIVGFSVDELLPNDYVMSHFFKADCTHKGVFEFLNERVSEHLLSKGYLYWNWEQDLGLESLHKSKVSYRPIDYIKKYTVTLKA